MSQALAVVQPPETDIFTGDRLKLIRDKFANGAPQHEFELFIEVCRTLNLDPLQRQVYLIPRNAKQRDGSWGKTWTIQTSIDGYRAIADRTGAYAGSDDAIFTEGKDGKPATATVTVWKFVQGTRCPFTATARWTEYVQETSPMWGKMPHTLLAKCAESLALRKAFPAQLSGVYTDSEMEQAGPVVREGRVVDVTTGEIIDAESATPTQRATHARAVYTDAKRRFADATDIDEQIAAGAVAVAAKHVAQIVEQRPQTRESAPQRAAPPPRTPDATPPAKDVPEPTSQATTAKERADDHRTTQNARYHATATEIGLNAAATKAFALSFFPHKTSRTQLTGQELHDIADAAAALARLSDGSLHPLVEFANAIADAPDVETLRRIAAEMKAAGVGTDWLRAMYQQRHGEVPAVFQPVLETDPLRSEANGEPGSDKYTG